MKLTHSSLSTKRNRKNDNIAKDRGTVSLTGRERQHRTLRSELLEMDDDSIQRSRTKFIEVSSDIKSHLREQRLLDQPSTQGTSQKILMTNQASPRRREKMPITGFDSPTNIDSNNYKTEISRSEPQMSPIDESNGVTSSYQQFVSRTIRTESIDGQINPSSRQHMTNMRLSQLDRDPDELADIYFDPETPQKVQVNLGETAHIPCKINPIYNQDKVKVSWIKDMQILYIGEFKFNNDPRFQLLHRSKTTDYILQIINVTEYDVGPYECQMDSELKRASLFIELEILKAQIEIPNSSVLNYEEGEDIKLTCKVKFSRISPSTNNSELIISEPIKGRAGGDQQRSKWDIESKKFSKHKSQPDKLIISFKYYIYWFKGRTNIDSLSDPFERFVIVRDTSVETNSNSIDSSLVIRKATKDDSGSYSCNMIPAPKYISPGIIKISISGGDPNSEILPKDKELARWWMRTNGGSATLRHSNEFTWKLSSAISITIQLIIIIFI